MYKYRFNLAVLYAKEKRLNAEINNMEKRLEEKKRMRDKVLFEKLSQEYKLHKLINNLQ